MKRAALPLLALLALVGCAPTQAPPDMGGARATAAVPEGKGEPVAIYCERGGWSSIQCTALYVYDWTPHWVAYVDGKRTFSVDGTSVGIALGDKWTLIEMTVTDGSSTVVLYLWAMKPTPTSAPLFLKYASGETAPGRKDE